jgi:peptide deformylase
MGHPVLRQVAEPVSPEILGSGAFQRFCDDLLATTEEYEGAGLAAPQVHVPLRVVVLVLDDERGPEFLVNPVITPLTTDTVRTWEGCLSVEGMRAAVDRPSRIRLEALDRDGSEKRFELSGFPAVVVQHECDHLDGVLYIDRCDTKTLSFMREYRRFGPAAESPDEEEDDLEDFDSDEVQGTGVP